MGFSATTGSRLLYSMRRAASCCQPLQLSLVPVGAWSSTSRKRVATLVIPRSEKEKAGIVTGPLGSISGRRRRSAAAAAAHAGADRGLVLHLAHAVLGSLLAGGRLFRGHADALGQQRAHGLLLLAHQLGLARSRLGGLG